MEIPLTIQVYKPSELSLADYYEKELTRLVGEGYGFGNSASHLLEKTRDEYVGDDDRMDIYLGMTGYRAVGSLCLLDFGPQQEKRGKAFWERLGFLDDDLYRALKLNQTAVEVSGVVTLPQFRGMGVARRLFEFAIDRVKPAVVLGKTKTPAAVLTRTQVLHRLGYTTFLGGVNLSHRGPDLSDKLYRPIKDAYLAARRIREHKNGILREDPELLLPDAPKVDHLPEVVQKAFLPIIESQRRSGGRYTATLPLTSIDRKVIRPLLRRWWRD